MKAAYEKATHKTLAGLVREHADALYVGGDTFLHSRRNQIATLAALQGLPAAYPHREWAEAGGLTSYGTDFPNVYRLVGTYTGLILKGEKPADLPVVQPSKFEFVINLKTAKALGLTIPVTLLAARRRGDRIIRSLPLVAPNGHDDMAG